MGNTVLDLINNKDRLDPILLKQYWGVWVYFVKSESFLAQQTLRGIDLIEQYLLDNPDIDPGNLRPKFELDLYNPGTKEIHFHIDLIDLKTNEIQYSITYPKT